MAAGFLASAQHAIILWLSVCNHYIQLHGALEMLWQTYKCMFNCSNETKRDQLQHLTQIILRRYNSNSECNDTLPNSTFEMPLHLPLRENMKVSEAINFK